MFNKNTFFPPIVHYGSNEKHISPSVEYLQVGVMGVPTSHLLRATIVVHRLKQYSFGSIDEPLALATFRQPALVSVEQFLTQYLSFQRLFGAVKDNAFQDYLSLVFTGR